MHVCEGRREREGGRERERERERERDRVRGGGSCKRNSLFGDTQAGSIVS